MNGVICDNCSTALRFDTRNGREDSQGEFAAWVKITASGLDLDACSRSCATELLADGSPLAQAIDAYLEMITDICRAITDQPEGDEDD